MKQLFFIFLMATVSCATTYNRQPQMVSEKLPIDNKIIIYQMMTRLFGNQNTTNKTNGLLQENGAGKFNDITYTALDSLKALGITHIWYTGILEHATMTDFTKDDIALDDPDVIKGIAGSPYSIKDYYDVAPALAVNVKNRIQEFENLIKRTHSKSLKVIIDFVPNHVARKYFSDAKPAGVIDFGEKDDTSIAFSPKNDFYYIPGKTFVVPESVNPGNATFHSPLKDNFFRENPAKATGNSIFSAAPSIDDWYETVKLNYGIDVQIDEKQSFSPIPPVWYKMRDILVYWAKKKVDGFRCDVVEMVPVAFWTWVIPQVKKVNPPLIFIGEAYDPTKYKSYLTEGNFDFLYDKVGLYDTLKSLIKNNPEATVKNISLLNKEEDYNLASRMLRFLENHDEERIASRSFAGNPWKAKAAMVVTATLSTSPVMIYFGQETGEPAKGIEGFGGDDGRTTIFDYWGVPQHQKWVNHGKFDGGQLNENERKLRRFYQQLLILSRNSMAIKKGFCEIIKLPELTDKQLAYARAYGDEKLLILANFDTQSIVRKIKEKTKDILNNKTYLPGSEIIIQHNDAVILKPINQ